MAFIFGGDTNMSYEDVQNKRKIAESLLASNLRTPQNVGEGIAAIGRALAARTLGKRSDKAMDTLDAEWATKIGGMGVDPSRIELWKNLPYDQRNAVALQYMDTMDAERRANARAGASASAAAAKEAAKAAEEAQKRQAIIAALGGGAPSQAPSGDFITGGGLSFGSKSPPPPESNPMPQGNVNTSMLRNGDPNLIAPMMMPPAAGSAPVQPPVQQPAPVQPPATAMPPMPTTPGLSFGTMQQQPQSQEMDIRAAIARELSSGDMETASALAEFVDVLGAPEPDLTSTQREYEMALAQGFPGSLLEYQTALAEAQRDQTNVSTTVEAPAGGVPADEEALRKKLGEGEGTLWSSYLEQGGVSSGTMADMQLLDELITMAPQGPVQGRLANAFTGFNSAADAFNSVVKRVAPTLRAPGSGSTSDVEYDGMLKSLPQLSARPAANAAIAAMMKAKAQINIERARVVQDYQGELLTAKEARERLREIDSRSIMTPELSAVLNGLAPAPTNTTQSGVTWSIVE